MAAKLDVKNVRSTHSVLDNVAGRELRKELFKVSMLMNCINQGTPTFCAQSSICGSESRKTSICLMTRGYNNATAIMPVENNKMKTMVTLSKCGTRHFSMNLTTGLTRYASKAPSMKGVKMGESK